ncbi:MAG: copper chaperone PCu(A)C [Acetobacteraceae bacterium]|nr:copper chaperone PCu(A)C [Acetobacteraceae bacterium]
MTLPRRGALAAALALLGLPAAAQHAPAGSPAPASAPPAARAGDIAIASPWTRAAGANANGAGFMLLSNTGSAPDRLVSAASPAARVVELHTHIREGEVMRMRPVPDIPIPPGETVRLQPGGLHVMLIGLTRPLERGQQVPLTLRFERGGEVTVLLEVQAAGARGPGH